VVARKFIPSLIVVVLVALSACSSGGPSAQVSPSKAGSGFPMTLTSKAGEITLPERPSHIVSLSPTATEMLFAIGAGAQVVAVDAQSDYPASAPKTSLSYLNPNIEAIASYSPDLVVIDWNVPGTVRSLGSLGVPVLAQPPAATLDESYSQIAQLGQATGHTGEAAALVSKMRTEIQQIVASMPQTGTPLSIYHELDDTYYSATSETFIGQIYSMLGLGNIADGAAHTATGYPQLSAEYIISSDPDLIFLADTKCCHQTPATVAARPGWDEIAAVRNGNVVALDEDIASRWGPRVVDFIRTVAEAAQRAAGQQQSQSPAA